MSTARLATISDKDWVRRSFLLSRDKINESQRVWQIYCSADSKFTDSSLGGNFVLNPPPQFTPYADIRHKGLVKEVYTHNRYEFGMGHYYSEAIDDNGIATTLRFGLPEYNGMWTFFTGFYDNDAATLANSGIINQSFFLLGKAAGIIFTIGFWPLMVINAFGNAVRFITGSPSSKYYYLQPAMSLYWARTSFIATTLATQMGVMPSFKGPFATNVENEQPTDEDQKLIDQLHQMDPTLFKAKGGIDIYAVATKAQRVSNRRYRKIKDKINEGSEADDIYTQLRAWAMDAELAKLDTASNIDPVTGLERLPDYSDYQAGDARDKDTKTLDEYLALYHGANGRLATTTRGTPEEISEQTRRDQLRSDASAVGTDGASTASDAAGNDKLSPGATGGTPAAEQKNDTGEAKATSSDADAAFNDTRKNLRTVWNNKYLKEFEEEGKLGQFDPEKAVVKPSWLDTVIDQFEAEVYDASQFISFRVDNPGTINESFSNSSGESDIAGKINGAASSARNARFTFSDGDTGVSLIDDIKKAVTNLAGGFMEGIHISGLLTLAGAAFVDIPKVWQSSSASFPTASYTIKLRSPYGNKMSRFMNLYVPLSALLAAALPISAGKQAYTAPFLCEAYSRGRCAIRLGMIESLTIARGVGNLGWNNDDQPLGIDVTFTIADLSTIMHAPIDDRLSSLIPWKGLIDDDTAFGDYMSVLSSMSAEEMIYPYNKFMLRLSKKWNFVQSWTSGAKMGTLLGHKFPGRVLAMLAPNPEISINR